MEDVWSIGRIALIAGATLSLLTAWLFSKIGERVGEGRLLELADCPYDI